MEKSEAVRLVQDIRYKAQKLTDALQASGEALYSGDKEQSVQKLDDAIDAWNLLINPAVKVLKVVKQDYLGIK